VARWQPDARGRLGEAAMELYAERGYEQTTVAEIAQRAGLTARTFFRYFADKREVLFAGSEALGEQLDSVLAAAPASATPLAAVAEALGAVAETIGQDRDFSRRRQAIISANAELQERELIKLAGWSAALTDGWCAAVSTSRPRASPPRPATPPSAWRSSGWLADPGDRSLADTLRDSFDQLSAVIAGG
jgi:AcrR family transcriptional regulator